MKLGTKLAVSTVSIAAVGVALSAALELVAMRERGRDLALERAAALVEAAGAEACVTSPETFPFAPPPSDDWLFGDEPPRAPRLPGLELYVLDAAGRPFTSTPHLPRPRLRAAREGAWVALGRRRELTVVPLAFGSPTCASLAVVREHPPVSPLRALGPRMVLVLAAVLAAVLSVSLPWVARLRRLTDAARHGRVRARLAPTELAAADELGELGRALASRDDELEAKMGDLEASAATLREHLAHTSHDVLLPITVLKGHLLELEAEGLGAASGTLRKALFEAHYVESLVRDLNADARLRTGAVVRAELDLAALVERVVARHAPIAARADVSLEHAVPEGDCTFVGDVTLLEQMLSNLVHNAVRYARPGGHVALVLERGREAFTLRVLDDNPGLDDAAIAKMASPGYRGDAARSRRPEGMGLGLPIVRGVVARHGGQLALRRNEPEGLVAEVTLPRAAPPA